MSYFFGRKPQALPFMTASILPLSAISVRRFTAYLGLQPRISATSKAVAVGFSKAFRRALMNTSSVSLLTYRPVSSLSYIVYRIKHMVYITYRITNHRKTYIVYT